MTSLSTFFTSLASIYRSRFGGDSTMTPLELMDGLMSRVASAGGGPEFFIQSLSYTAYRGSGADTASNSLFAISAMGNNYVTSTRGVMIAFYRPTILEATTFSITGSNSVNNIYSSVLGLFTFPFCNIRQHVFSFSGSYIASTLSVKRQNIYSSNIIDDALEITPLVVVPDRWYPLVDVRFKDVGGAYLRFTQTVRGWAL